MVKTITFIKRKPGMDREEFGNYWRTRHAPIVTRLPGLRRYVQCHTIDSGYRKGEPVYDGVAQVWFDSTDAMRATASSAEYRAVRADEPNFLDLLPTSISSSPQSACRKTRLPRQRWRTWLSSSRASPA